MDRPSCASSRRESGSDRGRAARPRAVDLDRVRRTERRRLYSGAGAIALAALELLAEGAAENPVMLAASAASEVRDSLGERDRRTILPPGAIAAAREEERAWVRCQLHDGALQVLEYVAGDGFGAGLAAAEVRALAGEAADDLRSALSTTVAREHRDVLSELRRCVGDVQRRSSATLELEGDVGTTTPSAATTAALVGAVREALTNAAKHAGAERVLVRLEHDADHVAVTVSDDGVGTDPALLGRGFGVSCSIHDRLARRGGGARIESAPGDGTVVRLRVPAAHEGREVA